jgi:hypothetical protein
MEKERNPYKILVRKPEEMRIFGIRTSGQEDKQ